MNVTLAVQFAPAARLAGQLPVTPKGPLPVTDVTDTAVLPVLFSWTVCAVDVVETFWLPKVSDETLRLVDVCRPVPDRLTVFVPPEVTNVSVPFCAPMLVGVNVTFVVQLPLTARLEEQLVDAAKGADAVTDVILTAVLPEFDNWTLCAADVVDTF